MSGSERVLRFAARLLPSDQREARLEEWLADLDGSGELGIPPRAVASGAARFAIVHGMRERVRRISPRSVLIGALAAVGLTVIAVPVLGAAGIVVANARGIVTVETAADGSERVVHWREYPGIAGLDPDAILAGPGLAAGQRQGAAMVMQLRDALTDEFGLQWRDDPNQDHQPIPASNRFGGRSMLFTVNLPTSQSTSVPREWSEKQRVIEIVAEIAASHGFNNLVLDHERWYVTPEDRVRDFGAAGPEGMVLVSGVVLGPAGQWLSFSVQDLRNDRDGRFADRLESAIRHGWESNTVTLMYGANGLLPDSDRAQFIERLEPFASLEQPEPSVSD